MGDIKRVIIDADVGTDDYLALLLLFQAEKVGKIKIEAIVCSMGNASIDDVCRNVIRTLETAGRTDIPVYKGSRKQLIPPQSSIQTYHGKDGFGDVEFDTEPDLTKIDTSVPAAVAVRNLVVKYPNEISLICLGPLTNAALAMRLFDDFEPNLKDFWIMGGNYTAKGNVTATAEYNFYVDPEAAHMVLADATKPINMVTWETCLKCPFTFDWRFNVFGKKQSPEIRLLNRGERSVYAAEGPDDIWFPCDAFVAAAFLDPEGIILTKRQHWASVEIHGTQTRGQVVLDHRNKDSANVTIIEDIDFERFRAMIMEL